MPSGGTGLSNSTRLRTYQKPPVSPTSISQVTVRRTRVRARHEHRHADGECDDRCKELVLRTHDESRGERGDDEHTAVRRRARRASVQQHRPGGQQQRDAGDVAVRATRLRAHERGRPEHDGDADQRGGGHAERAPDAPRGQQGEGEEPQVEHRREQIAAEEHDPQPVQERGVRREGCGKPGEVGVGVVGGRDRTRLHEPGGHREVVPEGVDAGGAVAERLDGPRAPLRSDDSRGGDRGERSATPEPFRWPPATGWWHLVTRSLPPAGYASAPDVPGARAGRDQSGRHRSQPEPADESKQLGGACDQGEPDHDIGEPRRRTSPSAQHPSTQRPGPDAHRRQRNSAEQHADEKPTGRHCFFYRT